MLSKLFGGRTISLGYILLIVILVSVNFWNFIYYYNTTKNKTAVQIEFQKNKTEVALSVLESFFVKGQTELAYDFLDAGKALSYFDFFDVRLKGHSVNKSANYQIADNTIFPEDARHFEFHSEGFTYYVSKKRYGPYELVVGYFPANENILSAAKVLEILKDNMKDTLVFFLCIFLIVFREYFSQLKYMREGRRDQLEKLKPISTEGKFFKDLFIHASNLARKKVSLEVPDGVETELARGTVDGEHFDGGMVRVDLNRYTVLCDQHGEAMIDSLLSPVFSEFREIAQRYGFYEAADEGDERVFYRRSEERQQTALLGISMIRSLFEAGEKHAQAIKSQHNIDFVFKASFAFDKLTLKKEDGKYKIKGRAFSISKRCIGLFKKRLDSEKHYTIAARKSDVEGAMPLLQKHSAEIFELDGFGKHEITFANSLRKTPQNASEFQYFLSNEDISLHLNALVSEWSEERFWSLYKALKDIKLILKDPEHRELLLNLIKHIEAKVKSPEFLASALMLLPKVVRAEDLTSVSLGYVTGFLHSENSRVKANALEALGALDIFTDEARAYLTSENNRIRANALVIVGKKDVGPEVAKNLQQLLQSENELYVSSGLYVVDQLFAFHSHRDLTLVKTAALFQNAINELKNLKTRGPESLRHRCEKLLGSYEAF
ncbi:MAG: HEAT repeat domain-containing protein [Pseudobdellovibrionaceae bacterium]